MHAHKATVKGTPTCMFSNTRYRSIDVARATKRYQITFCMRTYVNQRPFESLICISCFIIGVFRHQCFMHTVTRKCSLGPLTSPCWLTNRTSVFVKVDHNMYILFYCTAEKMFCQISPINQALVIFQIEVYRLPEACFPRRVP